MNKKYFVAGIISSILCIACIVLTVVFYDTGNVAGGPNPDEIGSLGSGSLSQDEPYVSPVDFASLQSKNADIHAWLTIPDTNVNYPIVQSPTDDAFYLRRSIDGTYSVNGTLFTEHMYNGTEFEDPVTAVYGHDMKSGAMFGRLQETYSDEQSFKKHKDIIVYLPDRELHYEVFAAVPYSKRHILYYYNSFKTEETVEEFLNEIYSVRAFSTNFDEDCKVKKDDKILLLSTCLQGDISKRYLVLARLASEIK